MTAVQTITDYFEKGIWKLEPEGHRAIPAFFIKALKVLLVSLRGFFRDNIYLRASALTFYSLLSLAPLLAMTFAIAKGFGLEEHVKNQLISSLQWQGVVVNLIIDFAENMLNMSKKGLITGLGALFIFYLVIAILGDIEKTFNTIWEVKSQRNIVRKFTDYLAMVFIITLSLIFLGSLNTVVSGYIPVFANTSGVPGWLFYLLLEVIYYSIIWLIFTIIYIIMPYKKVRFISALSGGIFAGSIYLLAKWIYVKFQIGVSSYGDVYSNFAALPLFLAWLQISWVIMLFGVEVSYASESYILYGFDPDFAKLGRRDRMALLILILRDIVQRFCGREEPPSICEISVKYSIPYRLASEIISDLEETGLVSEVINNQSNTVFYQPALPSEAYMVGFVIDTMEKYARSEVGRVNPEIYNKIRDILEQASPSGGKPFRDLALTEL